MIHLALPLLGLALALPWAPAVAAPSPCPPASACPDGYTDIHVLVGTETDYEDFLRGYHLATAWYSPPAGLLSGGDHWINSASGLRHAILRGVGPETRKLAGKKRVFCGRIKYLGIFTHGSPGLASFDAGSLHVMNMDSALQGLDCAMADDARIKFAGCNVGRGCRGEDFMMRLASLLLRRGGGSVEANTQYSSTPLPGLVGHVSIDLNTQALSVGPGLARPRWDDAPKKPKECRKAAEEYLAELTTLERRVSGCKLGKADRENLDDLRPQLEAARDGQDLLSAGRTGFGEDHVVAQNAFFVGVNNFISMKEKLSDLGPCRAPDAPGAAAPDPR